MAKRAIVLAAVLGCSSNAAPVSEAPVSSGSASAEPSPSPSVATQPTSAPSAATQPTSAASAVDQVTVHPAIEGAIATVKSLIVKHDEQAIRDALTPAFLEHIPMPKQLTFFDGVHARGGACTTHSVVEIERPTKVKLRFECEKMPRSVTVGVDDKAPHRINYLLIKPAK